MLTFGMTPKVENSSQSLAPKPTTDDPTVRIRVTSAGVGVRKVGLDDHNGDPAVTRNTVSPTSKDSPAHRRAERWLTGPSRGSWCRFLTMTRAPTTARPNTVSIAGQKKLLARVAPCEGGRWPRPNTHSTTSTRAATAKPTPSHDPTFRSLWERTATSIPTPARTARAKDMGTRARRHTKPSAAGNPFRNDTSGWMKTSPPVTTTTAPKASTSGRRQRIATATTANTRAITPT